MKKKKKKKLQEGAKGAAGHNPSTVFHSYLSLHRYFLCFVFSALCLTCCDLPQDKKSVSAADGGTDTNSDTSSWQWKDNPEGENCDAGCRQVSFAREIKDKDWDIWDQHLVYRDENSKITVVDIENQKHVEIPAPYADTPIEKGMAGAFSPTIYENTVYYVFSIYGVTPGRREIISVNLDEHTQQVVWTRQESGSQAGKLPESLDVFEHRLVSTGGAGNPEEYTLSTYVQPWPTLGEVLINETYGGGGSIWGNTLVFWDERDDPSNIKGYDFDRGVFFPITQDDEHQYAPRIQGHRVVYMDFGKGENDPWGHWQNARVFMFDLDDSTRKKITVGNWITANPDIYDDVVVWMDYRKCRDQRRDDIKDVEIWGLNIETKNRFQITNLPGRPKVHPRIFKDKVFILMFDKKRSGNAIYMFDLPKEAF